MCDAVADDRKTERDVDCLVHAQQLEGNMTLVMIHGDDGIKITIGGPYHQGVRWQGARDVQSGFLELGNSRLDHLLFFISKEPLFSRVRVERCHAQSWCLLVARGSQ